MYIDDNGCLNFQSRGEVGQLADFIDYYKDFSAFKDELTIDLDKLIDDLEQLYFTF